MTAVAEVVTALLADVRDLFYLVDGSNLRPRLRPHPALSAPAPSAPQIEADARQKGRQVQSQSKACAINRLSDTRQIIHPMLEPPDLRQTYEALVVGPPLFMCPPVSLTDACMAPVSRICQLRESASACPDARDRWELAGRSAQRKAPMSQERHPGEAEEAGGTSQIDRGGEEAAISHRQNRRCCRR